MRMQDYGSGPINSSLIFFQQNGSSFFFFQLNSFSPIFFSPFWQFYIMNFQPYGNSPLRTFNKMVFLLLFFIILAVLHFGFSTIWQFSIFFSPKKIFTILNFLQKNFHPNGFSPTFFLHFGSSSIWTFT